MKSKCSHCHKEIENMPFTCRRCGEIFCSDHRLPDDHECEVLKEEQSRNQERWASTIKNDMQFSEPKNYSDGYEKIKKYKNKTTIHRSRNPRGRPRRKNSSFKFKKLWRKNRGTFKEIIKWAIVLLIIYFAFQYYQNNDEKINSKLSESVTGLKTTWSDLTTPYAPSHEIEVNKSYSVGAWKVNKIDVTLHEEVYAYFRNSAPHEYTYTTYSEYSPAPEGWEEDYWKMFLENKHDKYIIEEIVSQVTNKTKSDGDAAARAMVLFVQKIPYAWDTYAKTTFDVQYPYETLYLNKGVCAEKALLMAKLLNELGYGIALFEYNVGDHMTVGIECPYDKSNYNSGYCFIEPSDVYPIGKIPTGYVGGADIRNEIPAIYPISRGKSYSK